MNFACNEVDVAAVGSLIAQDATKGGVVSWLLVDAALLGPTQLAVVVARQRWRTSNTLEGSKLDSFGPHAPQLIELIGTPDHVIRGLESLRQMDRSAPALSVIYSRAPLSELRALFAWLAHPRIDGDLDLHCRFADTRVLPHLLSVLSPAQRFRVSQCVEQWRWLDRMGRVGEWRCAATGVDTGLLDDADQIQVDKAQFDAMLEASEPDIMFTLLLDNTPELVPTSQRGQFHQTLVEVLAGANTRGLKTPDDRLQFVILSLSCGLDFHLHAGLATTWEAVKDRGAKLCDQMKQWSDDLWTSLQAATPQHTA
jgi:Domain of unknown function (DUF4123)